MKLGSWEIDIGFLYHRLPEDWDNLDLAFNQSRPVWNNVGIHLWHESTDEAYMLEIRLSRSYGARASYSHMPPYWITTICGCVDCKQKRRKLGLERKSINRPRSSARRRRW
ncbi:MAG: hypothetical protein ABSF82_14535 [Candidatus Bathyarchaeia archaeon]|jgi:hypothetical protein